VRICFFIYGLNCLKKFKVSQLKTVIFIILQKYSLEVILKIQIVTRVQDRKMK